MIDNINNDEIWKDIQNYEGYYKVSNYGRIFICERFIPHNFYPEYKLKIGGYIIKPRITKAGYIRTKLCKKGIEFYFMVHRLVGFAFVPNPHSNPQINHKDGNKSNNYYKNLEWVTAKENIKHALETGLIKIKKIVQLDALTGEKIRVWNSTKEASLALNLNIGNISSCLCGRTKIHGGYKWQLEHKETCIK